MIICKVFTGWCTAPKWPKKLMNAGFKKETPFIFFVMFLYDKMCTQKQRETDGVSPHLFITVFFLMKLMALRKRNLDSGFNQCNEKEDNTAIKLFYYFFSLSDICVCLFPLCNISNIFNWLDLSSHSSSI